MLQGDQVESWALTAIFTTVSQTRHSPEEGEERDYYVPSKAPPIDDCRLSGRHELLPELGLEVESTRCNAIQKECICIRSEELKVEIAWITARIHQGAGSGHYAV